MSYACQFYEYDSGFFGRGDTCAITGEKVPLSSNYYDKWCRYDYNRRDCPRFKEYGPYEGGCFITTVIHDILDNPDNCQVLNDFRDFRKNILQLNPKYYEGLKQYDNIGPIVANYLKKDENAQYMAERIYKCHLLKVHKYYKEGKFDEAYTCYCQTTLALIYYYGLNKIYNYLKKNDYGYTKINQFNPTNAGHGIGAREFIKRRVKTNSNI